MAVDTPEQHEQLIQSLMDPHRWPQGGARRRRIDTHISSVVLAGNHAYKLKKPIDLGFLNFKTIASRKAACDEELRLNRRLAPAIYQKVCAVTGSIERPVMDGNGEPIDWAVRMQRFDPDAILSMQADRLSAPLIDGLAARVAAFHGAAAVCDSGQPHGSPEQVYAPMQQNFVQIRKAAGSLSQGLERLQTWTQREHRGLAQRLQTRKREGHIRECHGDLHLGNVALIDDEAVVFDAIEFNAALRWIDTINDVGFLTMDLTRFGRVDLKYRFLDRYLEVIGDYAAVPLLRFYEVYRALVRAKIAAIRQRQSLDAGQRAEIAREFDRYVTLADQLTHAPAGGIVITRGVSGSGKSFVAATIPGALAALRVRSDVERKRLLGVEPTRDATAQDGYTAELTRQTYARLLSLCRSVVGAGLIAVVDATFLRLEQRDMFRTLAQELALPFVIVDCDAPPDVLRERITARRSERDNVSDAGLAVLHAQLETQEPLNASERACALQVRPGQGLDLDMLARRLQTSPVASHAALSSGNVT